MDRHGPALQLNSVVDNSHIGPWTTELEQLLEAEYIALRALGSVWTLARQVKSGQEINDSNVGCEHL